MRNGDPLPRRGDAQSGSRAPQKSLVKACQASLNRTTVESVTVRGLERLDDVDSLPRRRFKLFSLAHLQLENTSPYRAAPLVPLIVSDADCLRTFSDEADRHADRRCLLARAELDYQIACWVLLKLH